MPVPSSATAAIDILMVTYERPNYVRMSLPRLLESCDDRARVWLWHNGTDEETLEVVTSYLGHPRVHRFHHSPENVGLTEPTNWLWSEADGDLLGKVDDDCLVDPSWTATLTEAHATCPSFGVLGSWRFYDEDFEPRLASRKIRSFPGGHSVMVHPWVQGSGYLMKRACLDAHGLLEEGQSFTNYCVDVALGGRINGWYYPFVHEEHLDDPRSPHTGLKTDADLMRYRPLSAALTGPCSLAEWEAQMRRSARRLQEASPDPRHYRGWRAKLRRIRQHLTGRAF